MTRRAKSGLKLVRDLRERGSEMSVQRRSFVSTGPTRDDPAVIQIWAEWRKDGSGLRQGSPGVLVSVTVLSTWFIVLIYGRLTLTLGLGFGLPFFRDALLACKLLFDHVVMDSNNTNFSELTMRVSADQPAVAQRGEAPACESPAVVRRGSTAPCGRHADANAESDIGGIARLGIEAGDSKLGGCF